MPGDRRRRHPCPEAAVAPTDVGRASGSRPGASLPVGIERVLHAAHQRGVRQLTPEAVERRAHPPRGAASRPAVVAAARAAASASTSSVATWTVPTPTSAIQRHVGDAVERAPERAEPRRAHRDPAAVLAGGPRRRRRPAPVPHGALPRVDVAGVSFEQHVRRAAVPERRPTVGSSRPRTTVGRVAARTPPRDSGTRLAAEGHLHEHAERAERADEQAGQVVAGDVLHRGPAAADEPAVGGRRTAPRARRSRSGP